MPNQKRHLPAFSARRLSVRPESFSEPLAIHAPKSIQPQDTLSLALQLNRSNQKRYATVAIVDEGILSLTGYQTPDPLKSILANRRLETRTFDTVGWAVQLKHGTPAGHTGGDAPATTETPRGVKSVVLWAGPIEIPKNGRLPLRFKLPDYTGRLRVMAVAIGTQAISHAEHQIEVRAPLTVQATLPRFVHVGDAFEIPVYITNTTEDAQRITLGVTQTEPVSDRRKPTRQAATLQSRTPPYFP